MSAGRAALDPADVQCRCRELALIPAQVDKLRRPEAMPVGHEDHGGIAMPPAVSPGGTHEAINLRLRQVLSGS